MSQAASTLATHTSPLQRPATHFVVAGVEAQPSVIDKLLAEVRRAVVLAGEQQSID